MSKPVADVQARVREAAARYHLSQSPTFAGLTQGGFTLPPFVRGPRYRTLHPAAQRPPVTADFASLAAYDVPASVTDAWHARYPRGLNALQLQAVNGHGVLDGRSLLVVAPTSSGKTFIGELAAVQGVLQGRKAAFLVPYRALANEKHEDFTALYGQQLGLRVILCTGDHQDDVNAFARGKYDIAFLTYEMFLQLAVGIPGVLEKLGVVVLDEVQFISDNHRGIVVELILTQLRGARERGVEPQLVALSAVIGDVNAFDEWLGVDTLVTRERPVPLELGVLDRTGTYEYLSPDGTHGTTRLLNAGQIVQRRASPSLQDVIVPLVRQLLADDPTEQVLIFRNNKGFAAGAAKYLAAELGLPPAHEALAALPPSDPSGSTHDLRAALSGGTAFHTANLTREERVTVERAFRDPAGSVRVLTATTTVAAGVNTPARTVIVVEHEFVGGERRPFSVAGMHNMMGRLGYNEFGRAIVLAETPFERANLMRAYVLAPPEPLKSSFAGEDLGTWALRLLSQVRRAPIGEVAALLVNTYGGFLLARRHPEWTARAASAAAGLLVEMQDLDLVEVEDGEVRLSLLGQACGNSSLSYQSIKRLLRFFRDGHVRPDSAEAILAATQATVELDGLHTPMQKRGVAEGKWRRAASERLGPLAGLLQRHADDEWAFLARCKRTLVLLDWMDGRPIAELEERYKTNAVIGLEAGNIRGIADATRFHARSVVALARALLLTGDLDEEAFGVLLARLEFGVPRDALGLVGPPVRLNRGEVLALFALGVSTLEEAATLPPEVLAAALGNARAAQVQDALDRFLAEV